MQQKDSTDMGFPATINDALARGTIPADLEGKTQLLDLCREGQRRSCVVAAMVIAAGRRDDFGDARAAAWLAWTDEHWSYDRSTVHRMRKVGDMLLESVGTVARAPLFALPMRKLEAIAVLWEHKPDQLDAFLGHVDVQALSRDEVREKVHFMLDGKGLPPKGGGKTGGGGGDGEAPVQLDFFAALDAVCKMQAEDRQRLVDSTDITPLDTVTSGLTLVRVTIDKLCLGNTLGPQDYEAIIEEMEQDLDLVKELAAEVAPVPLLNE